MITDKFTALLGAGRGERVGTARKSGGGLVWAGLLLLLLPVFTASAQQGIALQQVDVSTLPGDRVQIQLGFSGPAPQPQGFTIDNPARVALDFVGVSNALPVKSQPIDAGVARSLTAVEAQGRTRVVLNLSELVAYETRVQGDKVFVTLGGAAMAAPAAASAPMARDVMPSGPRITEVDFRRGAGGEGRVLVALSDPSIVTDVRQEGTRVVVDFLNTSLPPELARRLDVTDFATPVQFIETSARRGNVRMVITPTGEYEHLAYQSDNQFAVEVRPLTREEKVEKEEEFKYTGQKLSLNFQDIEVRAVLQLLADFTGLNLVASDSVRGNVTLRLQNVPWDQALDIILKTKGLDKRIEGNVMMVAPAEEIAAREKLELETKQQVADLAPLRSEILQVNYAKASDIAVLLKAKENNFLTSRGSVTIDDRTNVLLVQDTAEKLDDIRALVAKLDIPVRQVLIESRVVVADTTFQHALGVRFGITTDRETGGDVVNYGGVTGNAAGANTLYNGGIPTQNNRFNVNLPAGDAGFGTFGTIGLALAKLPFGFLLDLELSAMEADGRGEVISSPRVLTSNQKEASIETGTEVPYQEATSSGATNVEFKKAVLSLKVKPQITPDDRVIMDLSITKDAVNQEVTGGGGEPGIDTNSISSQVLVDNGETVVLGGVFEQNRSTGVRRVPFFGELPYVGWLFRSNFKEDKKKELLIFVTPKIIKETPKL